MKKKRKKKKKSLQLDFVPVGVAFYSALTAWNSVLVCASFVLHLELYSKNL